MLPIILASSSPQRKTLLESIGLTFDVIPSSVEESACKLDDPAERATVLARLKAEDVAKNHPDAYVIGCDTLVVAHDGTLLEKAVHADEARVMIEKQSGTTSTVHSAVCVILRRAQDDTKEVSEGVSTSTVTFKALTPEEIDWWIDGKYWQGRSGSFQIDGKGQLIFERMEGDWTGIVGLPIYLLGTLFTHLHRKLHP